MGFLDRKTTSEEERKDFLTHTRHKWVLVVSKDKVYDDSVGFSNELIVMTVREGTTEMAQGIVS